MSLRSENVGLVVVLIVDSSFLFYNQVFHGAKLH